MLTRLRNVFVLMLAVVALAAAGQARADEGVKKYAVLPFTINGPAKYAYLSNGIQEMLISRLHWKDHFQAIDKTALRGIETLPASEAEAQKLIGSLGVDHLIWGSLTILGEQGSLDLRVKGDDSTAWPISQQVELAGLIPALENVTRRINGEVFQRPVVAATPADEKEKVQVLNPGLVYNESDQRQEFYLNPEFRYQGAAEDGGRIRSQKLPFPAIGMRVGDLDNDGTNEVVLLANQSIAVYRFEEEGMRELVTLDTGRSIRNLAVGITDFNRDGHKDIVVGAMDNDRKPKSYILNYKDGKLVYTHERISYFLSVVRTPPEFLPTLIGQRYGHSMRGFFDGKVYEMLKSGGEFITGKPLLLPSEANPYNFVYLPDNGDYKVVLVTSQDNLRVLTASGEEQFTSEEKYCQSGIGIEVPRSITGKRNSNERRNDEVGSFMQYLALRPLAADIDGDGNHELITPKPVSVASQFFERYRHFPQGEVHALKWDGVGLDLLWKTRRVKISLIDIDLADINNDGVRDLVLGGTTHPGTFGVNKRRTVIYAYPLDVSAQDTGSMVGQ